MANIGTGANKVNPLLVATPIFMAKDSTEGIPDTPGTRLKRWIIAKYGSWGGQKKCAQETGIDEGSLSKYVNDKRQPDWDSINRLGDAGLNTDWWLKGRGPMNAPNTDASKVGASGEIVGTVTFETVEMPDGQKVVVLKGLTPHENPPRKDGDKEEE